jgi:ligand-binding SRPBCC domain-containing protein
MHLKLTTKVTQHYLSVKEGFDEKLFLSLNPPFPPVKLKEFGGCKKGDIVHLELNFIFFKQDWVSEITYDKTSDSVFEFIDEGTRLPFFLKFWQHHHLVEKISEKQSLVIDDIKFKSPFVLMDLLLFPVLWLQFAYRKPIYKRIFKSKRPDALENQT